MATTDGAVCNSRLLIELTARAILICYHARRRVVHVTLTNLFYAVFLHRVASINLFKYCVCAAEKYYCAPLLYIYL